MSRSRPVHQRGSAAFALVLAIVGAVGLAAFTFLARAAAEAADREQRTALALATARQALIGFAIRGTSTASGRPGDLPCPDLNNDGIADAVPGCSAASARIGRLPWRTLGLPDLRDGNGERLWYAVSTNFKDNPRTPCTAPGMFTCLNSDTPGTITVRSSQGVILNNGSQVARGATTIPTGAVAVVIAPGPELTRVGAAAAQDRSCSRGGGVDTMCVNEDGKCTGSTLSEYIQTARCNPVNYLDVASPPAFTVSGATGSTEDNATLTDSSIADGLIAGPVLDAAANVIVNDRLLAIDYSDLMPLLEQRVVRQAFACLAEYGDLYGGRYPYAADDYNLDFSEKDKQAFGRMPDAPFSASVAADPSMGSTWGPSCVLGTTPGWWMNWKDQVYYGVAKNLQADGSGSTCLPGSTCLTVNPPSSADDKNLVVLLAGRTLSTQLRGMGSRTVNNFLESANATVDSSFRQSAATSGFNDVVLFR